MKKILENKKIYVLLFILNIIVVFSFLILNYFSDRFSTHNKHITYTITNIKYLSTQSHLWMEEYLNGDNKEFSKIASNLDKSIDELDTLLNGGVIKGFKYTPSHSDQKIIDYLQNIHTQLINIQSQTKNRLTKNSDDVALDEIYDKQFETLIDTLDSIDIYVTEKFKIMFANYTNIKYTVYISIFFLILIGVYLIIRLNKEIDEKLLLSYMDTLTGIQNVKGYKKNILHLLTMYNRYKSPFIIIMFDIDNFKDVNDTYGHRVGDIVLIDLVSLVNSNIRDKIDTQFRVGGEEFVVLCPNITLNDGRIVAEKIRNSVEKNLKSIKDRDITISVGVSEANDSDNEDSIYRRVDRCLYFSKNNGKNIVTSHVDI